MAFRVGHWLALSGLVGALLPACGGDTMGNDGGVGVDARADMSTGSDVQPDRATGTDVVTGTDVQGTDVRDVVGTDAVVADVVTGTDVVVGMDVVTMADAADVVTTTDVVTGTDVVAADASDGATATACGRVVRALTLPMDTATGTLPTTPNTIPSTTCQARAGGAEDVYSLHVATRTGVQLAATTSIDSVVSIRRACDDAASEVACDDDSGPGTASLLRTALEPGDYFVIMDQYAFTPPPSSGGAYTLDLTTFAAAPNALCSTAAALTSGSTVTGDTAGGGPSSNACSSSDAPQLFYTLTIPPGDRATVTATPTGTTPWRAELRALDTCAATSCTGEALAATAGAASTLTLDNRDATDRTVVISVAGTSATTGGTFTLRADIGPLPAGPSNTTCAMATSVTNGTSLMGQEINLGGSSLASACVPGATGPVLYYSVAVPPTSTLTVRAAPTGSPSWDAVIRLLDGCAATTCISSVDSSGSGTAETIAYTNTATTARTIIVAVSSYSSTAGTADISFSIPYTGSTTATACDDLSAATPLAGPTTDDSTSTILALPFAFTFFGTGYSNYSAQSNGMMQLWPGTTGTPSTAYANAAIPSTSAPNNFIAPFWDDLRPVTGASDVRTATVGTAPDRHFTVQWTGWTFSSSTDPTARLTFQAHLFEGTNVVEFHYCTLATTDPTSQLYTGSSATIGLENATGTTGAQYSSGGAIPLDATTAIRFTPAP